MAKFTPKLPTEAKLKSVISDPKRLNALRDHALLDTPAEESFDWLTRMAVKLTGAPVAFVSLVDQSRDFYKSQFGFGEPLASTRQLDGRTFCHYAISAAGPLVLADVTKSAVFANVPTVKSLGVRAYVGIPLVSDDGYVLGSFCAIDFKVREWTELDIEILSDLASCAMRELKISKINQAKALADARLIEQMQKINELNQQLENIATTDPLTGVRNRRFFSDRLAAELAIVARQATSLSLLMVDVDHFKRVNDHYGHAAGDKVLQVIASLLAESARDIDTVARIGGEEFAVILPNTDNTAALAVAERLRVAVANADWPATPMTISIGTATLLKAEDACTLMKRADQALYAAKAHGRNHVMQA